MRSLVPGSLRALAVVAALGVAPVSAARAVDTPSAAEIEKALTGGGTATAAGAATTDGTDAAAMQAPIKPRGIRSGGDRAAADRNDMDPKAGIRPMTPPREANLSVPFATGSAEVSPLAARVLDELGLALTRPSLASARFRIEGHTDTVGSPESNRVLSERRADSVAAYLARRHGIDPARLQAVGLGQDGLLVPTGPGIPEIRNRRVLVVNLGG